MIDIREAKNLRELFTKRNQWIKGKLARTSTGEEIGEMGIKNGEAVSWCLVGGLMQVTGQDWYGDKLQRKLKRLAAAIRKLYPARRLQGYSPNTVVVQFNNSRSTTFKDIRKVIEQAKA